MVQQSKSNKKDSAQEYYSKSKAGREVKKEYDSYAVGSFLLFIFAIFSSFFLALPFLGIIVLLISPLLLVASIVFGVIGLQNIKKNKTYGRGYALAGIILSSLGLLCLVLFALFVGFLILALASP